VTTAADDQVTQWQGRVTRMSPDAVRRYAFGRTALGRRGYVESDVERFRARVADELARADAEKAELREELGRLRNYFRDQRIDAGGAGLNGSRGPSGRPRDGRDGTALNVQAVNLLSQAQQAADQHIAAAEDYARNLVRDGRRQYEDILVRAHQEAEEAAELAAREYQAVTALGDRIDGHEELAAKLAYMRTFAEVTQVQMRSILDALRQELDRLADVNASLPIAPGPAAAGVGGPLTGSPAAGSPAAGSPAAGSPAAGLPLGTSVPAVTSARRS
jgi:cell division septum initiation protein DivIVA